MNVIAREPAVVIGLVASIALVVAQQVLASGIVTSANGVNVLNLIVSIAPLLAGIGTRRFVSPVTDSTDPAGN